MNKNIKTLFILTTFLVLLVGITTLSATDVNNTVTSDVNTTHVVKTTNDNAVADVATTNSNTNAVKKTLKTTTTKNVNDSNFDTYFTSNGLSGVNDGDTISLDEDISRNNHSYIVDKAVTINGNNHIITLNTTSGSYTGNQTGSSFIFDYGAAGTNVTDINFYNTQVIVRNTTNIIFDNIGQTVFNQRIGQGIGTFSIRDNSSYITVENSRFSTTNNSGSSTLVLAAAHHCVIDNNNITGSGNVGNLLYLTTYNIAGMNSTSLELNSYNNITNNKISRPEGESNITYGITLTGHDNNIENNIIDVYGQGITTQWFYTDPATPEIGNNSERYKGNYYTNNTINNGASFKATNNSTITSNNLNAVTLVENCTFINNNATSVSVTGKNNYFCKNNIGTLTIGSSENNTYICKCNNITNIVDNKLNKIDVECNDCGYCSVNSYLRTMNNKILRNDGDNVFIYNITDNETFFTYFRLNGDTGSKVRMNSDVYTVSNAEYILNITYVPSKITTFLFDGYSSGLQTSIFKVDFNNMQLNNTAITVNGLAPLRAEFYNLTLNYDGDYDQDETGPNFYFSQYSSMKQGALIENITINSKQRLTTTSSLIDINLITIRPYYFSNPRFPSRTSRGGATTINNVTLNLLCESAEINWDGTHDKPYTIPIVENPTMTSEANATISNCHINFNETYVLDTDYTYSTIWAAYLLSNNTFINNTINIKGSQCVYGVVARGSNNIIVNNTINSECTGYYACGINVESSNIRNNIIENNHINVTAGYGINKKNNPHVAYGALILDYSYTGGQYKPNEYSIENVSYINNTIIVNGGQAYGVEIYGGNNLNISDNTINMTSRVPMGIGAIGENITMSGNTIICNGTNNSTETTVDYLTSRTVGVYNALSSVGINITDNIINMTSGRGIYIDGSSATLTKNNIINVKNYTYTVELSGSTNENIVTDNYLISNSLRSDNSVYDNGQNNTVINNGPNAEATSIVSDPVSAIVNTPVIITANVTTLNGDRVTSGDVVFTDSMGNVLGTVSVTDGSASINATFTRIGSQPILVTYEGNEAYLSSRVVTTVTVNKANSTSLVFTINPINAQAGDVINLTASLTDTNGVAVNGGKVAFKVNGKTIRDANGKVIYAHVENGQAVIENFVVPVSWTKAGTVISAVYSGNSIFEGARTSNMTINVTKRTATTEITTDTTSVKAGETISLSVSVKDNEVPVNTGRVIFKINGKTLKDTTGKVIYGTVENGVATITYTIPSNYTPKDYTLTCVYSDALYNRAETSKTLTIVN